MPHECPLCLERFDSTDERFYPCACSYQICLWCYHRIRGTENRCPKCRRVYTGINYEKSRLLPMVSSESSVGDMASGDELSEDDQGRSLFLSKKLLDRDRSYDYNSIKDSSSGTSSNKGDSSASSSGVSLSTTSRSAAARRPLTKWVAPNGGEELTKKPAPRSDLRDVRVVRRELCYVVGLSPEAVADEDKLKDFEYLGKYGTVVNVIVNRNPNFKAPDKKKSCALYVTYSSPDEAKAAIMDLDNTIYQGRHLKASYGTTKYCSSFLRGIRCANRSCYYLHSRGRSEDSFTVAQMNQVKETSRRLTCSALLASEFEAAEWKNNQNLFGVNRQETVKYFTQDPLGMHRPSFSTIAEEVEAIRAANTSSDDALLPAKKMSFVLLTPPPTATASAVHPALTVVPPPEGGEPAHLWPTRPQPPTHDGWNDWGFDFADQDFQNYNQVRPARMAPAQPSSLLDFYITPADSQAVCTHPALLQLNRDISSAQKKHSHHLDMPPGYGYAHHIYPGRVQPTSTSPSDEIAYQYCLIQ